MLYLISTPIGNLNDMTLRAIEVLKEADFIVAENPRTSLTLLHHYKIPKKPVIQFAEHNERRMLSSIINRLEKENGCLMTDAGTPGLSDPGFRLVRECWDKKIKVVPVPGASAVLAALSASGLPTDRFIFLGFAPRTESRLVKFIQTGKDADSTIVFFESPYRTIKTVERLAANFPSAHVFLGREMTKMHEEMLFGSPEELLNILKEKQKMRGEFTFAVSFKR
jgi:16S rRNA (cytidine1402-2'-O)-methyltransferase